MKSAPIIAHEMAHFTGRDTRYSTLVLPVYLGLGTSILLLTRHTDSQPGEEVGCYGCAFQLPMLLPILVMKLYLILFGLVDHSIGRSRELRADAIAANLMGKETFASALTKTVRSGEYFGEFMEQGLKPGQAAGEVSDNRFADFRGMMAQSAVRLNELEQQALAEKDNPMADHPALATRLRLLPDVKRAPQDTRSARELLVNANSWSSFLGYSESRRARGKQAPPPRRRRPTNSRGKEEWEDESTPTYHQVNPRRGYS